MAVTNTHSIVRGTVVHGNETLSMKLFYRLECKADAGAGRLLDAKSAKIKVMSEYFVVVLKWQMCDSNSNV